MRTGAREGPGRSMTEWMAAPATGTRANAPVKPGLHDRILAKGTMI